MTEWIAGDCYFFANSDRDRTIIQYWNDVVVETDTVLLMGKIFNDNYEPSIDYAREISFLKKLHGNKFIIDFDEDKTAISRNDYLRMGFNGAFKSYLFVAHSTYTTHILPDGTSVKDFLDKKWGAAVRSTSGLSKPFERNILSLSIDDWGLAPLKLNDIPNIVDNMVFYEELGECE